MPDQPLIEIVEILGPSKQGVTAPYLCRGDDDLLYYVKGRHAHCSSWWSEWICGHVGQALGLNLPPFRIVHVDQALLDESTPAWRELGEGYWFGSQQHPVASWLETATVANIPLSVRQDVLVFDWWIHNMDRTTGNTNLLWSTSDDTLVVIDHNQAFDPDFAPAAFFEHHVFADVVNSVFGDSALRAEYKGRLTEAVKVAKQARDNAPPEWQWSNAEQDLPCRFDRDAALVLLARCATEELWSTV